RFGAHYALHSFPTRTLFRSSIATSMVSPPSIRVSSGNDRRDGTRMPAGQWLRQEAWPTASCGSHEVSRAEAPPASLGNMWPVILENDVVCQLPRRSLRFGAADRPGEDR